MFIRGLHRSILSSLISQAMHSPEALNLFMLTTIKMAIWFERVAWVPIAEIFPRATPARIGGERPLLDCDNKSKNAFPDHLFLISEGLEERGQSLLEIVQNILSLLETMQNILT